MSYPIYNFSKQNDVQNNKKPFNSHLCIENETYGIYFVDSGDRTVLLKTTDEGENVSTVETRTREIVSGWHDRDNDIIYFVCCNGFGYDEVNDTQFTCFYIDLSDDSITEMGNYSGTEVTSFDIFKWGSDLFVVAYVWTGGTIYTAVLKWDGNVTWTFRDSVTLFGILCSYVSIVTLPAGERVVFFFWDASAHDLLLYAYEDSTPNLYEINNFGGDLYIAGDNRKGIAWDDDDFLYTTLSDISEASKEETTFTMRADVAGDMGGTYFNIYSSGYNNEEIPFYVWFDVDGGSADPNISGKTGIEVNISANDTAATIATAVKTKMHAYGNPDFFSATNLVAGKTVVTNWLNGDVMDATDGDIGGTFSINVDTQGTARVFYLCIYAITADALTQKGEYNISLMLDRNTDTSNKPECFTLEKAFAITLNADNKGLIYQIARKRGNLNFISQISLDSGDLIVAITDTYLIIDRTGGTVGTVQLWKYIDVFDTLALEVDIDHPTRTYPVCYLEWIKQDDYADPLEANQFVQVFGRYSSQNLSGDVKYFGAPDDFNDVDLDDDDWYFGLPDDFNLETVGTSGDSIAFVNTATLPNSTTCTIERLWQDHKNILKMSHDGGGSTPTIDHDFPGGGEVAGTREFWWGVSSNSRVYNMQFRDIGAANIHLRITGALFKYFNNASAQISTGVAVVNDTLYHHKIVWDCVTDTFNWTITSQAGVELYAGVGLQFRNNADTISDWIINMTTNAVYSQYIDAWGSPTEAGYTIGDNLTGRTRYGTLIPFVDSVILPVHTSIATSWQNHKQPFKLTHLADVEDPDFTHNITQITASIHEFYIGGTDTAEEILIQFKEDTTIIINLKIDADNIYYESTAPAWVDIGNTADDNIYHFKVIWRADNTFDVWIDKVLVVDNQAVRNNQVSGINKFYAQIVDNNGCSYYFDAYGDIVESTYYVGKNLVKFDDNLIIFEGNVKDYEIKDVRNIYLQGLSKELEKTEPIITDYTDYTGKTSGQIITQLISDFCNYITTGSISNGSTTWTCPDDWEAKGERSLETILNDFADNEHFTWRIRPTGELDFDDGSLKSYILFQATDKYRDSYIKVLSQEINQTELFGGFGLDGLQVGPVYANDLPNQQLQGGIITWSKTYSNQLDATALQTTANNKLLLQGASPKIYNVIRYMGDSYDFGFIQCGEIVEIDSNVYIDEDSDEFVPIGDYILNKNRYDVKNMEADWKLVDGLLFIEKMSLLATSETLRTQTNSQLVQQLAALIVLISSRIKGISIPASGLRAPGLKPATYVSHGIAGAWEFADAIAANEETVSGMFNLPKDMDLTVAPVLVLMWSSTTLSSDCYWQIEYVYFSLDEDTTGAAQETLPLVATGEESSGVAEGLVASPFILQVPSSTDLHVHWRIKRRSGEAEDTIADTVELHGVGFLYTADILGTV